MKLKYQMRGLGIGIIVTALLMGVATKDGLPLTDAEIKAKALTLGMVESDSLKLTDIQGVAHPSNETPKPADGESKGEGGDVPENSDMDPDEASGDENGEAGGAGDPDRISGDEGGSDGSEPENSAAEDGGISEAADRETGENNAREPGDGSVVIHIEAGMSSYDVSVVMADAGLVEDASAFDRYLCEEGYSRKIADGTYEIPSGATEEEIAKIITKGR